MALVVTRCAMGALAPCAGAGAGAVNRNRHGIRARERPLHDAVEMGRIMPAVMMFATSTNGLHCQEEDTPEPDLEVTIAAFLRLIDKTVAKVAAE